MQLSVIMAQMANTKYKYGIKPLRIRFVLFLVKNIFVSGIPYENQNVKFEIRISKSETNFQFSKIQMTKTECTTSKITSELN